MSLTKENMEDCCNEINIYFNSRYSHTEKVARPTSGNKGAMIIYFKRFNYLQNKKEIINQPVGKLISWMNEHIDQFLIKYKIPKERVIYGTYDFLLTKNYDYIVYHNNLSLELDSKKFNAYVKMLPKLP